MICIHFLFRYSLDNKLIQEEDDTSSRTLDVNAHVDANLSRGLTEGSFSFWTWSPFTLWLRSLVHVLPLPLQLLVATLSSPLPQAEVVASSSDLTLW